jgi:pyruvate ferredoxin oxidoreductase delta subunit
MGKNLLCEPAAPKKGWKEIPIGGVIINAPTSLKNKTGAWRAFRPVWDSAKCIHCFACVANCPDMCIPVKMGKKKLAGKEIDDYVRLETDFDYCKGCGVCVTVCPVKCLSMKEESEFMK